MALGLASSTYTFAVNAGAPYQKRIENEEVTEFNRANGITAVLKKPEGK